MTVCHHLDEFLALPTPSSLAVSSDGSRVMATVDGINEEGTEYFRVIRELDPDGHQPPRGLTEAVIVESSPSFTSHGELLFLAAKSNAIGGKSPTTMWLLPASGDHAVSVASALGGVTAVVTAREAPVAVVCAPMLPSSDNLESGRRRRELRKSAGVTAILHGGYPVRHRDADLGPEEPHLFALRLCDAVQPASAEMVELTPRPGSSLREAEFDVSSDGQFAVASWRVPAEGLTHRQLRSRLAQPDGDGAKPLVLWVRGRPRHSWNSWSWEGNPWMRAAHGFAVLLPDPALSTGYGQDFIQRGWGVWGAITFNDLMTITDVAVADPRIDATRTAVIGGSFGGHMAKWAASHTGRFAGIVSHAGLWALDQFRPTTDTASYWQREITPEFTRR